MFELISSTVLCSAIFSWVTMALTVPTPIKTTDGGTKSDQLRAPQIRINRTPIQQSPNGLALTKPSGTNLSSVSQRFASSNQRTQARNKKSVLDINRIPELSADKIEKVAFEHEKYDFGSVELSNYLAKFDDCTDYGVTDIAEKELIQIEIKRLVKDAEYSGEFMFRNDQIPRLTDEQGYKDVSNLSDQIVTNFQIIKHDNSQLAIKYCPSLADESGRTFTKSRRLLFTRYGRDEATRVNRKTLEPPERNQKAYFALVDYITSCVIRLLVRSASTDKNYWQNHLIAIIARWAVKLKLLSYDPAGYAQKSLNNGVDLIRTSVEEAKTNEHLTYIVKNSTEYNPDAEKTTEVSTVDTEMDVTMRYYRECIILRRYMEMIVIPALNSLLSQGKSAPDKFESSVVVYKTGLERTLTSLSSDREGEITASSDITHVKTVYTALTLLQANTRYIQNNSDKTNVDRGISTAISWEWPKEGSVISQSDKGETEVDKMEDLISLLVPLTLANPFQGWVVDNLMEAISSGIDDDDQVLQFKPPSKELIAAYSITTKNYTLQSQRARNYHADPEVCSLMKSPLRKNITPGQSISHLMDNRINGPADIPPSDPKKEKKNHDILTRCVLSEDSIAVDCKQYVWSILAIAGLFVAGGMAIPFTVQSKIRGVDPFQMTTFIWVVTGFFIIVCKSWKVTEWPWHDFLSHRVVCKSVSDLSYVTGLDPQVILSYLLQEERRNILLTRGPYNGMFTSKTENDGFAIDEPPHLSTMLHSGFVLLKVANEKGEHLVCMDVRKGAGAANCLKGMTESFLARKDIGKGESQAEADDLEKSIQQKGTKSRSSHQAGSDPEDPEKGKEKQGLRSRFGKLRKVTRKAREKDERDPVLFLRKDDFRFNKVLGIFVLDSNFG
ncbi:hypothetical protein GQ43DRAFT_460999 [Delitschia confertaspora ATCC 74209]|uniref:Uncharacterized protein n=1 Tax=Delitschia confertaspora ATCC 74209 TaxID=1513339 RepID=A0A9P4MSH5_9PLEO|nr:hypothetical protein GQ43DRAFT_460999 [Delitschia confertaspora ATCC 74209]